MKIRSLLLLAAGVVAGMALAKKMNEDDPEVLHGPSRSSGSVNPALRAVSGQAQRVADRAAVLSLEAIRRAREAIRERREEGAYGEETGW